MTAGPQRLDVTFTISWQGSWHVGSGSSSLLVDRRVSRRRSASLIAGSTGDSKGDRTPYVPGAQLKGVLRHQCEQLAAAILPSGTPAIEPHALSREQTVELRRHFQPLPSAAVLVDRLFGTRFQGGCLFVGDALPAAGNGLPPSRVHSRTAIDRLTGTVRRQHLFATEVVSGGAGTELTGQLRGRHPAGVLSVFDESPVPLEYALLIASLLNIETLGGDQSAGRGRCRVRIEGDLRVNRKPVPFEEALSSFADDWETQLMLARETAE